MVPDYWRTQSKSKNICSKGAAGVHTCRGGVPGTSCPVKRPWGLANLHGESPKTIQDSGGGRQDGCPGFVQNLFGSAGIRPQIGKIKQFAEYLQAEAEELSLTTAIKAASTSGTTGTGTATSGLKALAAAGATDVIPEATDSRKKPQGPACRFWGTDGGCKKGSSCTYAHAWDGLEKTNRCFACSGMGHSKRDCPVKKPMTGSPWKQPAPKVSKVKKPGDEKMPAEGQAVGGEGGGGVPRATGRNPGADSSASRATGEGSLPESSWP